MFRGGLDDRRLSTPPEDRAERRQVTVMFSDLVGSTALSAQMDPQDLREVIPAYQKCITATVHGFGGFVANYMGDDVLAYFGCPQAQEDDAERAVRLGLELITAIGFLNTGVALQIASRGPVSFRIKQFARRAGQRVRTHALPI